MPSQDDPAGDQPVRKPAAVPPERTKPKPSAPRSDAEEVEVARRRPKEPEEVEVARRRPREDDDEVEVVRPRRRRVEVDEDYEERDEGNPVSVIIPYKNARALIAYYLGIFSLIPIAGLLLGPPAVLFGILGIRYVSKHPAAHGTGHALAGIIIGSLTSLGNWGLVILILGMGWMNFFEKYIGWK
jgi:hypothetical protein